MEKQWQTDFWEKGALFGLHWGHIFICLLKKHQKKLKGKPICRMPVLFLLNSIHFH